MASKSHQFIADLIANKMYSDGYEVVGFDGLDSYEEVKLKVPPKILRHRPDLIGVKSSGLAIGEAKTATDLSLRTKEQLVDFSNDNTGNIDYRVYFGIPLSIEAEFNAILDELKIRRDNFVILTVPDRLLPYEENYNLQS